MEWGWKWEGGEEGWGVGLGWWEKAESCTLIIIIIK